MNKRISAAAIALAAALLPCAVGGCTAPVSTNKVSPSGIENTPDAGDIPDTEALTEHFETGSEFLLQDIVIVEATETPAR